MSKPPAMLSALLAILILAGCGTGRGAAGAPAETPRLTDPPAGTVFYKGRTIIFDEEAVPPVLVIDGTPIRVSRYGTGRSTNYETSMLAYVVFPSLWQLAHVLVSGHMFQSAASP